MLPAYDVDSHRIQQRGITGQHLHTQTTTTVVQEIDAQCCRTSGQERETYSSIFGRCPCLAFTTFTVETYPNHHATFCQAKQKPPGVLRELGDIGGELQRRRSSIRRSMRHILHKQDFACIFLNPHKDDTTREVSKVTVCRHSWSHFRTCMSSKTHHLHEAKNAQA